jgi:hypothetical protein
MLLISGFELIKSVANLIFIFVSQTKERHCDKRNDVKAEYASLESLKGVLKSRRYNLYNNTCQFSLIFLFNYVLNFATFKSNSFGLVLKFTNKKNTPHQKKQENTHTHAHTDIVYENSMWHVLSLLQNIFTTELISKVYGYKSSRYLINVQHSGCLCKHHVFIYLLSGDHKCL